MPQASLLSTELRHSDKGYCWVLGHFCSGWNAAEEKQVPRRSWLAIKTRNCKTSSTISPRCLSWKLLASFQLPQGAKTEKSHLVASGCRLGPSREHKASRGEQEGSALAQGLRSSPAGLLPRDTQKPLCSVLKASGAVLREQKGQTPH